LEPFVSFSLRLQAVRERIAAARARGGHEQHVTLVAVTKNFGPETVVAAWEAGITDIGENKVQEARAKQVAVTVPVRWHLIGHLQRNKVKALEHFDLFHALDSSRLADAVSAWAVARDTRVRVLLQVNVSGEDTKGGFAPDAVPAEGERLRALPGLVVAGAMTMAPFDAPERTLRECFSGARTAREALRAAGHPATELSMGMSADYEVAVEEGATLVRLGTILFGART
jgi:pyridoxal phosphate enzyme (YggS family)